MNFSFLTAICLTAIFSMPSEAIAQRVVDDFGDRVTDEAALEIDGYPIVNMRDWRSPDADIPWSEPIYVFDEFEGNYLAVIDKNFQKRFVGNAETGVFSNWSRRNLRIYSYHAINRCSGIFFCDRPIEIREARLVKVLVGGEVFDLTKGDNGNFPISDNLAYALSKAPSGEAKIKLYLEESGSEIISDIGRGTVEAWHIVYRDALPPSSEANTTEEF